MCSAGQFGVPQSRERVIVIAAAIEEVLQILKIFLIYQKLPSFPTPRHAFNPPVHSFTLNGIQFFTPEQLQKAIPFRAITVK